MVFWMIVMAANLVVGAFVGLTGVAGFLLPIVYTGPLGMGVTEGVALSFAASIITRRETWISHSASASVWEALQALSWE